MIRKRIIVWMKKGACISLAAVILSAAAVPSAGTLVFAQEDTAGVVVSEEEPITEEENEENRKKEDAQQKEETESGATAVKEKISRDPQVRADVIYPENTTCTYYDGFINPKDNKEYPPTGSYAEREPHKRVAFKTGRIYCYR